MVLSLCLIYASALFSGWLSTCKPLLKLLCKFTSSKALKVTRYGFTWATKRESWMLECFSWRCGPNRSRELEAEARRIQRENKVQIFFTVRRINYWNNLLEAVQGSLSHVDFNTRCLSKIQLSSADGWDHPSARNDVLQMVWFQTPDFLTVTFPSGLKNLWIPWTERTVYSVTGNGSHNH